MKIVVIGHGMVGHKFIEAVQDAPEVSVTVLCEEPRPAYDRVHLSDLVTGRTPEDLVLTPDVWLDPRLELAVGDAVAEAVRVVRESGLPNETTSMFTTIEGDWD